MHSLYQLFTTKAFLAVDAQGRPAERRLRVCVAAVLWEMAMVDGVLHEEEVWKMLDLLQREFRLLEREAATLVEVADYLRKERTDFNDVISEINKNFGPEQRLRLFELIMQIAAADRVVHPYEREFARYLRHKMNIAAPADQLDED